MQCCAVAVQCCANAVLMLCCGYACSRPKAVQSPDRGCAGSGLWLCWRSRWVQVWVCVGPYEGPCGSMYNTVWSGFALIWLRETDILRCFELQMWGKGVLKHAPACLLKSCMSLLIYLQIYIGAQRMCDSVTPYGRITSDPVSRIPTVLNTPPC